MGYNGRPTKTLVQQYGTELCIVQRPRKGFYVPGEVTDVVAYLKELGYAFPKGFNVLAKRWIVERTLAWLNKFRRLSKDYELLMNTSEQIIYLAMIRIFLKRMASVGV